MKRYILNLISKQVDKVSAIYEIDIMVQEGVISIKEWNCLKDVISTIDFTIPKNQGDCDE